MLNADEALSKLPTSPPPVLFGGGVKNRLATPTCGLNENLTIKPENSSRIVRCYEHDSASYIAIIALVP